MARWSRPSGALTSSPTKPGGLARLVDDLPTLSLPDAGELSLCREATSPRQLLDVAVASHRATAEAQGIRLELQADGDLPPIGVDADRIAQVLHNLLSNALRSTPRGGRIVLSARRTEEGVALAVVDSGPGIPEEDPPHMFERLHKGDRARQRAEGGSGLGLAIARSMVEMLGGRIGVTSPSGAGATFTFVLR